MTALTLPARSEDASPRPVPWRRMLWVTWRQHRVALAGLAAFLGALAVVLWVAGLQLHQAYAVAAVCRPVTSPACGELFLSVDNMNGILANGYVLLALPGLIGAFIGAPLLARELETGTFRYTWTQGFGRWRWTLAKLVALAVVTTAAAGAISALFSWYYQPYFAARDPALAFSEVSPLSPGLFGLIGVAFAVWTLAAVAIGALTGILLRRVVPAMAATLGVYAGLAATAGLVFRQHYLTPLVARNLFNPPGSDWIVSQWWTRGGRFAFSGQIDINLYQQLCPSAALPGPGAKPPLSPEQCFAQHGYALWTSYQPASRFWSFQWIEAGWLLALSVLLIALTVWLVRRRAA